MRVTSRRLDDLTVRIREDYLDLPSSPGLGLCSGCALGSGVIGVPGSGAACEAASVEGAGTSIPGAARTAGGGGVRSDPIGEGGTMPIRVPFMAFFVRGGGTGGGMDRRGAPGVGGTVEGAAAEGGAAEGGAAEEGAVDGGSSEGAAA